MTAKTREHGLFAKRKKMGKKSLFYPSSSSTLIFFSFFHFSFGFFYHRVRVFEGWLGNSPNLNPIGNIWAQMKNLQRYERATLKEGLKRIARKVWNNITQEYLASLYESKPRQMQAVVDAQGGHTKN